MYRQCMRKRNVCVWRIPVFPLEASTTVWPFLSLPHSSAHSISPSAKRSKREGERAEREGARGEEKVSGKEGEKWFTVCSHEQQE